MTDLADLFPGFESRWIDTSIGRIFARSGGDGPPLLLLDCYAQSNVMWHKVAPGAGAEVHAGHAGPAGLWAGLMCRANRQGPRAIRQALDGARIDRGDGETRPRALLSPQSHDRGGRVSYRLCARQSRPADQARRADDIIPDLQDLEPDGSHDSHQGLSITVPCAKKFPMPEMLLEKAPIEYLGYKMASWTESERPLRLRSACARALSRIRCRSAAYPSHLRGLSRRRHHRSWP